MKDKISARLEAQDRMELERRANLAGKSLSEFTAEIIHDALESKVRTDLLLQEMQENIVQLTGMMSIMQAYNTSVYAVLMGRTAQNFDNVGQMIVAKNQRDKAKDDLKILLSEASKDVISGENVWGIVEEEG